MTATELIGTCDISRSTVYRKLERLNDASLVREQDTITPGEGRTTTDDRDFDDVMISREDEDDFSETVERPLRKPDERLADIWLKTGDEL